ncbi:CBO0543 family protein [Niallia sp. FSL R7-0271]|uniref:CBO0543 family protein n=1 Tax=Niallia sp. FSL R7-0271 TaxID=2921678 RepID=UPI0030FC0B4F
MEYQEALSLVDEANKQITEANKLIVDAILHGFLWSWQWWVAVGMIIVPWTVWIFIRDKKSAGRLLAAGLLIMVLSEILDTIGVMFGLWTYPVKVFPVATINFSFRLSVLPVVVMLLMQYKPKINPFIKAIGFGAFGAYIGLPLLSAIDLYKKVNWAFTYSFFILTVFYLLSHFFINKSNFNNPKQEQ